MIQFYVTTQSPNPIITCGADPLFLAHYHTICSTCTCTYVSTCMRREREMGGGGGGGGERESRHLRFNRKMKQRITIRQNKLRRQLETYFIPRFGRKP